MLRIPTTLAILLVLLFGATDLLGQERLFPGRGLFPTLLAGPRDPTTSATLLGVFRNPNEHGEGVEVEFSIGSVLPVYLLSTPGAENPVVVGIEAVAFARFGLQVLQRELIATDWAFAVPIIWHHGPGWTRFRYFHASSHIGDEYSRRFEDPGVDFSRDAAEVLTFRQVHEAVAAWAGVRYGYNVHPESHERWVLRGGGQIEATVGSGTLPYFLATDLEWEQSTGSEPRIEVRLGTWLPSIGGRRALTVSLNLLSGPSPLGQFHGYSTTQLGLTLRGNL